MKTKSYPLYLRVLERVPFEWAFVITIICVIGSLVGAYYLLFSECVLFMSLGVIIVAAIVFAGYKLYSALKQLH